MTGDRCGAGARAQSGALVYAALVAPTRTHAQPISQTHMVLGTKAVSRAITPRHRENARPKATGELT